MTGSVGDDVKKDFFISRSGEDARWAEWIAWQLEAAGYSVIIQDWDFAPGSNFVAGMRRALDATETVIALYSPAYFSSSFTEDEWTAAIVRRGGDDVIRFLPIRVTEVDVPTLLMPIVYVDLVGLDEQGARARILAAAERRPRTKPPRAPGFPGADAPSFPRRREPGLDVKAVRVVNTAPTDASRFTDRSEQVQGLRDFLHDLGVRLVSIVGRVGLGKSALACHVFAAERETGDRSGAGCSDCFDAIVFLSSRTTGLSFERVYADLRRLLDDSTAAELGEHWSRRDVTLRESVEFLLDSLCERRVVVVLDGLDASLEDGVITEEGLHTFVQACLDRADAPHLVVTSRVDVTVPPASFPLVRSIRLRTGLPIPDAVMLLRNLDPQGELGLAGATEDELKRAAELVDGIPRALELLAGILQARPAWSLSQLLSDDRTLGTEVVERLVAEAFEVLDHDEQRVLEVMAAFDAPVTDGAIRFVVHTWFPDIDVSVALRRLVASNFATATRGTGEYLLQSTDRPHAYGQIPETAGAGDASAPGYHRAAVESRVADYYESVRLPSSEWRSIDSVAPQIAEFEHRVRAGGVDRALEVLDTIDQDHLFLWGHYTRLIELRRMALPLAARPKLRAANLASLGVVTQVLGQYDASIDYYEQAVKAAEQAEDADAQANYVGNLGRLYRNLGYMDKALKCSTFALEAVRRAGDREAVGRWQDRLGLVYSGLGRLDDARTLHEQAASTARGFGDRRSEGAALSNLGVVLLLLGLGEQAHRTQRDALALSSAVGDRRGDAIILGRLGVLAECAGDFEGALALHEQSLAIAQALGERREQSYQLLGRGKAHFGMEQLPEAERDLRAARDLDVPETSYLAALTLSLILTAPSAEGSASFADVIRLCEERLSRSADLFAARYALATATVGAAACTEDWADEDARAELLSPALQEFERAVATCNGRGAIAAALRDVQILAGNIEGLEPVTALLEHVLVASSADGPDERVAEEAESEP